MLPTVAKPLVRAHASLIQNMLLIIDATGLEHATIRDNIVFGCAYGFDKSRYEAVLDACALVRDFDILDAGDLTGCFFPPDITISESATWQKLEKRVSHCRGDNERGLLLRVRYILKLRYHTSDEHRIEANVSFQQCILLDDP